MPYLHENGEQFAEAINLVVFKTGLEPEIIEKDYYVSLILKKLSEKFEFIVFKGGTSLQKCHRVISRFSEDIDISIDNALSNGQKRKVKYGIVDIAEELGMTISNINVIKGRRDYNRYELAYDSVLDKLTDTVKPVLLIETYFAELSFPTETLLVHSYIGELLREEAPDLFFLYDLAAFSMKVQGIERTLVDKVFAICDYYLKNDVKQHSRHIYDIYKLLSLVVQDKSFKSFVNDVRLARSKTKICPSAMPDVDVNEILNKIIETNVYREDYNMLTVRLLEEKVGYEEAIKAVKDIAAGGAFAKLS